MNRIIEICANSAQSCVEAEAGGAARVELCAGIPEGGTTPSYGEIVMARQSTERIAIHVLIRPRAGDFLYTATEVGAMLHDIQVAHQLGVQGVVIGCLTPDGDIDEPLLDRLMAAARPLSVTFHRAFDVCRDPHAALELLIRHGVDRVLIPLLRELVSQADGRIVVMPGCGVRADNIARIESETGAREFHTSARRVVESGMIYRNERVPMGSCAVTSEFETVQTDRREVARYVSQTCIK